MKLYNKQKSILKKLSSSFIFKLFSIIKLPLAIITGLKIQEIDYTFCKTIVNYKYLNKNPFNSTYFAVKIYTSLTFVKNKNSAPTIGSKIRDDKIGKFIILQLKKLKKQKNLQALRMHTDK